jgi:hypothetical protein
VNQQTIPRNRDTGRVVRRESRPEDLQEIAHILVDRLQRDGLDLQVQPSLDEMKLLLTEAVRSARQIMKPQAAPVPEITSLIRD